ncbi:unnamed protein product [Lymnaea stagnalis]|uniref:tRNA (cytosine(38)-C(5))-methyltransferase n=1 Tax=Lymnaea stagnalis TaxID=6523 RepID=A0AAV2IM05_LYMST
MQQEKKLRILELYSGIGGMHWALKESGINYEIVLAVDINTTANKVYEHNFSGVPLQSMGIEKLSLKLLDSLSINAILMSPPCQPFTRVGKKGDCNDIRTKSFLHILGLVSQLLNKPDYILVENVKGFETSQTREKLVECLKACNYSYQEFLLTPLQFGVPNCRLRYYLIANLKQHFSFAIHSQISNQLPSIEDSSVESKHHATHPRCHPETRNNISEHGREQVGHFTDTEHSSNIASTSEPSDIGTRLDTEEVNNDINSWGHEPILQNSPSSLGKLVGQCSTPFSKNNQTQHLDLKDAGRNMRYCEEEDELIQESSRCLSEYMEDDVDFSEYWLSDKELRMFVIMDIVYPDLKKSICFTKRYGHYVEGAGSVVQMSSNIEHVKAASELKSHAVKRNNRHEWGEKEMEILRQLKLRYFTPREVANLLCFPKDFNFPPGLTKVQKYRVLGNSLNVLVVAQLIRLMTHHQDSRHANSTTVIDVTVCHV